nr:myb-related protein Myb4-like [Ipomoea trifida]
MEPAAALKKGPWSPEEDRKLVSYIMRYGIWNWRQMPRYADSWNSEIYQVSDNNINFSETPQVNNNDNNNNMMTMRSSSQVVILESSPNSFAPPLSGEARFYTAAAPVDMKMNISPSSDVDATADFWYNMLAEAERL